MPGAVLHELHRLWRARDEADEYFGTLVNAWLAEGGEAVAVPAGTRLCRCRHARRLSRGDAAPRRGGAITGGDAHRAVAAPGGTTLMPNRSPDRLRREIAALGPWFHNIDLGGVSTAPDHFLGDYPAVKWRRFAHALPDDLTGKTVLDIGCNGGFYSLEMKRRGAARVLGIDHDADYLRQARFAAEVTGLDIEFVAALGL